VRRGALFDVIHGDAQHHNPLLCDLEPLEHPFRTQRRDTGQFGAKDAGLLFDDRRPVCGAALLGFRRKRGELLLHDRNAVAPGLVDQGMTRETAKPGLQRAEAGPFRVVVVNRFGPADRALAQAIDRVARNIREKIALFLGCDVRLSRRLPIVGAAFVHASGPITLALHTASKGNPALRFADRTASASGAS